MTPNTLHLSQLIKSENFKDSEKIIVDFIEELANKSEQIQVTLPKPHNPFEPPKMTQEESYYVFIDQFAALITELFSNKNYYPGDQMVATFLSFKYVVDCIFTASVWSNTDALIEHLGVMKLNSSGQVNLSEKNLTLLLMLVTISSKYKLPWGNILKSLPARGLSAYIGLITQHVTSLSDANNKGYNHLLASAKDLPIFELPVLTDLGKLAYSFFSCSYATSPDKYEFKKWMTATLRANVNQWISQNLKDKIKKLPKTLPNKRKLKVLVMLEMYNNNHAMFRCFHILLNSLLSKHDVVVCYEKEPDKIVNLDAFPRSIAITNVFDIENNVKLVLDEEPDVILYTSIGMKFWSTYLSQLRLAPLQLMNGGHPSSSYSPEMDNFLIVGNTFTAEEIQPYISEKVIVLENTGNNEVQHTMHSDITDSFIAENNHFNENDTHIKIAINGVMTKVTYAIIDVCKKIEKSTNKKVTFIFFSRHKKNHISYLSCKKQLTRMLKSIELVSYTKYIDYMKIIAQCHFLLPTLPFGGTNSNVDAMILNKPKLFLKGKREVYTRTDECEWARVDLVGEFGADDIEELTQKAIEWVNNQDIRKEMFDLMLSKACFEKTFNHDDTDHELLPRLIDKAIYEHSNK